MKKRILATLLSVPLAWSQSAQAEDLSTGPTVKISGFGTGALTMANTDEAQFSRANQASGVSKDARTGVDSNLGLQAGITINDWLSASAQGLVRKEAQDDYGADLTLAFLKAKVSENFSVRVGRMGLPVFMISEYRNVGYANTFVRPPIELYSQVPFNSIDGIDGIWQQGFGDTTVTAQLALGRTKADLAVGSNIVKSEGKDIRSLSVTAERGPLTLRFGHSELKVTVNNADAINGLMSGLRSAGATYGLPQLGTLADRLELNDSKTTFTSVGMMLDWNDIIVQSEFGKAKSASYIKNTSSWYVVGGYRIGKFLPYYSHADLKNDGRIENTVPSTCPAGAAAACTSTLAGLSGFVGGLVEPSQGQQSTDSIGVRWDFHRAAALKVQVDRIKPKGGGYGLLLNPVGGFHGGVTVAAVAIDFVF